MKREYFPTFNAGLQVYRKCLVHVFHSIFSQKLRCYDCYRSFSLQFSVLRDVNTVYNRTWLQSVFLPALMESRRPRYLNEKWHVCWYFRTALFGKWHHCGLSRLSRPTAKTAEVNSRDVEQCFTWDGSMFYQSTTVNCGSYSVFTACSLAPCITCWGLWSAQIMLPVAVTCSLVFLLMFV